MELNDPRPYHRYGLNSLGWELTVCNSLSVPESPCFQVLKRKATYGSLLYGFILLKGCRPQKVLEVGGGYGFLARDFLRENPDLQITLWDISPFLRRRQQETLRENPVIIEDQDILTADVSALTPFDLVVMNEMMGDLPTLLNFTREEAKGSLAEEAERLVETYQLSLPAGPVNFNLGAILALEKVLTAQVKWVFVCEHSCEASVPAELSPLVQVSAPGIPEAIPLRGHTEYTIQFSHLEQVARAFSYQIKRGPIADFIPLDVTERLRVCLRLVAPRTEEEEIVRQFVSDLFQYEYLLLTRRSLSW